MPGQRLFRGVLWRDLPSNVNELKYPPAARVTKFQRANRPGDPRFYCSAGAPAAIFELSPRVGDRIAVSEWEVQEKLWMLNVGYEKNSLSTIGSARQTPHWQTKPIPNETIANRLVHRFLASEFTREVPAGAEHFYKLSTAIAEKLAGRITSLNQTEGMPSGRRFAGLQYPALAMRGDADNIVLHPDFVDRNHLVLKNVRYVNIDERTDPASFQATTIDFADVVSATGIISWWSRRPCGLPGGNRTMRIAIEDGMWISRDKMGNIVE
jgi:hypothetical protein